MTMICNVPDEVVKSVKMGTWCGSSVVEKMIANGILFDKIRAEIKHFMYDVNPSSSESDYACNYILQIIDKYKAESEPQGSEG